MLDSVCPFQRAGGAGGVRLRRGERRRFMPYLQVGELRAIVVLYVLLID